MSSHATPTSRRIAVPTLLYANARLTQNRLARRVLLKTLKRKFKILSRVGGFIYYTCGPAHPLASHLGTVTVTEIPRSFRCR